MKMKQLGLVCVVVYVFGAASVVRSTEPPNVSPEQQVLDQFLGTWHTTYKTKAEGTPGETVGAADLTYRRTLGGQFVQEQGEHADKSSGLAMYTYDAQRKCYLAKWFQSSGQAGESRGTWDPDAKTFTWNSNAQGIRATSYHRFVGNDTFEWGVVISDGTGKVAYQMEGKATRTNDTTK